MLKFFYLIITRSIDQSWEYCFLF